MGARGHVSNSSGANRRLWGWRMARVGQHGRTVTNSIAGGLLQRQQYLHLGVLSLLLMHYYHKVNISYEWPEREFVVLPREEDIYIYTCTQ